MDFSHYLDIGEPVFSYEQHCSYYFDWTTKYACDTTPQYCSAVDGDNNMYDLSVLTRATGKDKLIWRCKISVETRDMNFRFVENSVIFDEAKTRLL